MIDQPYVYQRRELIEPDWRRFPTGSLPSGSGRTA
jgi:hypothetical protein